MSEGTYALSKADENRENERLKNLEAASDAFTIRHLEEVGATAGWRCLEIGAGGGSIASWLAHCVGPSGSVIATDVDPSRLTGLPAHVEVRRHDITTDHLEPAACDVAHCRFLLQHLPDPDAALERMVNALAPGGWLVVEEADFGLFELSGAAESADATRILHDLMTRWRSAEMLDSYFGRRLPAVIGALELSDVGFDHSRAPRSPGLRNHKACLAHHARSRGRNRHVRGRPEKGRCGLRIFDVLCGYQHFRRMGP